MKAKKLITSALPYVNNVPHLGNVIGCVLSADVYARFCRVMDYETLYICATDEYGTATETKARQEGVSPKEICDKYHKIHKQIYGEFNIAFDFFGRTSDPEQTEVVQQIFMDLECNKMVEEQETAQTYCEHDQMFLADRFVEGDCPFCGYDGARGDQCDQCGKLLQPMELKNPKCQICGNTPTEKKTKHLYIKLPELTPQIKDFQEKSNHKGKWSNSAVGVSRSWLERGLLPRPITRDLKWGIPVPRAGYENKVFYVWFDAPIGYISATKKYLPDSWEQWWKNPDETELYQFMGKDNVPFHTVIFPATLLGTKQNWTMLHHINTTEYLNYENQKFSKSRNTGVFANQVTNIDIHIDLWRFYLLHNRPEKSDSNFSWDGFIEDINSNFIDNIGNLLNRVLVFFNRYFKGKLKQPSLSDRHQEFLEEVLSEEKKIVSAFESVAIRETLNKILALGRKGNKYFQDSEPWATIKTDSEYTQATLTTLIYLARDIGILLFPYMPETSAKILSMIDGSTADFKNLGQWDQLSDIQLKAPEILYQKLQQKKINQLKDKFGGKPEEETVDPLSAWDKIEIKVGEIKSIQVHPSADRLYQEEIDCGEGRLRTIVSGLVKYYQPDELLGKKVLIATNLKPVDLRGVLSEGMVLTAEKKKKLEVITQEDRTVGSIVTMENREYIDRPEDISIDTFFEAKISVKDNQVNIDSKLLQIDNQTITTQIVANGKIK
ncbi:MAG: methionine--tRNA ligase [Deltaproteobacteria bacterium]|nr:methionine--tRNA ligase [Deltaproteobacteria bacterium]